MYDTFFIKHKKYLDQIQEDIDDAEKVISKSGDINFKSFDLHDELNREIWDEKDKLHEDIRTQLLQIAHDFYDTLDIQEIATGEEIEGEDKSFDKYIKDVLFVGSLASYNYSSYADVDLHLLMDENKLTGKNELAQNILKKYFTECKNDWNLKHSDLKVKGYDCELYVQDVSEKNASNGCYSLTKNKWLVYPKKLDETNFDREWIAKKAIDYIEQIDELEKIIQSDSDKDAVSKAKDKLKTIKDKIVQGRRDSLAAGQGEMNKYNILFKILRRSGHIEKINDLVVAAYDELNSIKEKDFKKGKNKMNKNNCIVEKEDNVDSVEEFRRMFGDEAVEALETYIENRPTKSVDEILETDEEFEKFANWAYKHLDVDVYANFSKYDVGTFYDRTSSLSRNPMDSDEDKEEIGTEYTVVDQGDEDYDDFSEFEESNKSNKKTISESDEIQKEKVILGAEDDKNTILIVTHEPDDNIKKISSALGVEKWEKDPEYSYWYFVVPMKLSDVQNKIKQFENFIEIEIQESKMKESESAPKVVGKTWDEFVKNVETQTDYNVDSAFKTQPEQNIDLLKKSDNSKFNGEVTKYSDGTYELMIQNIKATEESKKQQTLNEDSLGYGPTAQIENIKSILRRYFEVDPRTGEDNPEYDESFDAQSCIDSIVDALDW